MGDVYCVRQMYDWPGFDQMHPNPKKYFKRLGIEFDGNLFIRFPMKLTFNPIAVDRIVEEERTIGVLLPIEYKLVLEEFGRVNLPVTADVTIETPLEAVSNTRCAWWRSEKPLPMLAISTFNTTSDGNGIGFIRTGSQFSPVVYEFSLGLLDDGDDPLRWARPLANSLSEFLLNYLDES